MTITFITGANKGLGYETARRLIDHGHTVILGARDAERGRTAAAELGARFVQIDVTDAESVASAAADIHGQEGVVDVLINNAGIAGPHRAVDELTAEDVQSVFDVNVLGIVRATAAFLPLLRRSAAPPIPSSSTSAVGWAPSLRLTIGLASSPAWLLLPTLRRSRRSRC